MTRREAARRIGLDEMTLRYWERVGMLPPFSDAVAERYVRRAELIAAARRGGISFQRLRQELPPAEVETR